MIGSHTIKSASRKLIKVITLLCISIILLAGCNDDKKDVKPTGTLPEEGQAANIPEDESEAGKPVAPSTPSPTQESKKPASESKSVKLTGAIFSKGDNVYIYSEPLGKIKPIGDPALAQNLPILSPNKAKVVFSYFVKDRVSLPPKVGIYDIYSDKLTELSVKNRVCQQLLSVDWINENTILTVGHVNPSVTGYVLYNAETGEEINTCAGVLYQVLPDTMAMLFGFTPHVFPPVKPNIALKAAAPNSEVAIYESNDPEDVICGAKISKDLGKIAIWTQVKSEAKAYIMTGDFDYNNAKTSLLKKNPIDEKVQGTLLFDDKNNVLVKSKDGTYKLQGDEYVKIEEVPAGRTDEMDNSRTEKFNEILKAYFSESKAGEDQVHDIQWFGIED